jgi:hypothetical protein
MINVTNVGKNIIIVIYVIHLNAKNATPTTSYNPIIYAIYAHPIAIYA